MNPDWSSYIPPMSLMMSREVSVFAKSCLIDSSVMRTDSSDFLASWEWEEIPTPWGGGDTGEEWLKGWVTGLNVTHRQRGNYKIKGIAGWNSLEDGGTCMNELCEWAGHRSIVIGQRTVYTMCQRHRKNWTMAVKQTTISNLRHLQ